MLFKYFREFNIPDSISCSSFSPLENGGQFLLKRDTRSMVDLNRVQDEIEKVCVVGPDLDSSLDGYNESISNGLSPRLDFVLHFDNHKLVKS